MILELAPATAEADVHGLLAALRAVPDVDAWPATIGARCFVIVSGDERLVPEDAVRRPPVLRAESTLARGYWLVDRANGVLPDRVRVGGTPVGGGFWCAAGPCALEDVDEAVATARALREHGAHALRIGVFKPRTNPYNFRGKGAAGLEVLPLLRAESGLPVVTEVLDPRDVEAAARVADCLQVGTRNMTNQALLLELGRVRLPVLLKRGSSSPVEEWLRAAEYVVSGGNPDVILCARGIVSFDTSLRFTPDVGAILAVRERTALPVVFDPSHAAGRVAAVGPLALAAAAMGADGILIECHPEPAHMHQPGDAAQAADPRSLPALLAACAAVRAAAAELDWSARQWPDGT